MGGRAEGAEGGGAGQGERARPRRLDGGPRRNRCRGSRRLARGQAESARGRRFPAQQARAPGHEPSLRAWNCPRPLVFQPGSGREPRSVKGAPLPRARAPERPRGPLTLQPVPARRQLRAGPRLRRLLGNL
eukprot:1768029-Pyramimonas_sp.AAC.1